MASIRKQGAVYEIRECRRTERGPRQFALARFRGALTPEVIEQARASARTSFAAEQLIDYATSRGIPVCMKRQSSAARRLIGELQHGRALDPTLVALLKQSLETLEGEPLPVHLSEAADWLGRSETTRGRALRGLLRSASRIARSRGPTKPLPEPPFPRFTSREAAQ